MDHFAASLLSTLLALGLVLVLAWVALAALRRIGPWGRSAAGQAEALQFIRALPVGPRERVVVLRYRGEELLVGVSAGGVQLLARQPVAPADDAPP